MCPGKPFLSSDVCGGMHVFLCLATGRTGSFMKLFLKCKASLPTDLLVCVVWRLVGRLGLVKP